MIDKTTPIKIPINECMYKLFLISTGHFVVMNINSVIDNKI
nr:MAG TPA: hypothetical protein [Caudoviricetes sp.]